MTADEGEDADDAVVSHEITFESGPFLHSLFGDDPARLREAESMLGVLLTARDGLLKVRGGAAAVDQARRFFEGLEEVRRGTGAIDRHGFRMALEAHSRAGGQAGALAEPFQQRLAGVGGRSGVVPRTLKQADYLRAMQENTVVFGMGPAGTGKTYLAVAQAADAIRRGLFRKLLLTRPAVEAGEALGFLPGDLNDKILPYLRPLYDALYDILGSDEVEKWLDRGVVEIAPLAYMRGRTLNHAYILLDEAQNTTCEQMFMFLTRLGEESRCVVTGDASQIDLRPARKSGLLEAARILRGIEGIAFITFGQSDVVRHPVVQRIIEAYERTRGTERDKADDHDRNR